MLHGLPNVLYCNSKKISLRDQNTLKEMQETLTNSETNCWQLVVDALRLQTDYWKFSVVHQSFTSLQQFFFVCDWGLFHSLCYAGSWCEGILFLYIKIYTTLQFWLGALL